MSRSLLHVITPSRMAGAETLLVRLAMRQHSQGDTVRVVSNSVSPATAKLQARLAEHSIVCESQAIGGKVGVRALLNLRRVARENHAQILHSHLSSASWWCGWLDATRQFPSVGHVHGFTSALWHRRQRHLIAVSQAVKLDLVRQGVASHKITVLPNPVALDDVQIQRDAAAVRREMGAGQSTFVVGTFAHLSEKKGWRDLFEAIPMVLRQCADVQFWCAGDGPLRGDLEKTVKEAGMESQVRILGFRRDVADLMNAMNMMVLPSHREPFGLVYVEAALLGKPSIACNAGGAPEVVQHESTGLLVPPHTPQLLAEAIVRCAQDTEWTKGQGAAAREFALQNFGWEKYFDGLETVYAAVT